MSSCKNVEIKSILLFLFMLSENGCILNIQLTDSDETGKTFQVPGFGHNDRKEMQLCSKNLQMAV